MESADPDPVTFDAENAWYFGGFGSLPFGGHLDDVQLYDRALDADEVSALRDAPGEPLSSGEPMVEVPESRFATVAVSRSATGSVVLRWLALQDVGYLVAFSEDMESWAAIEAPGFSVEADDAVFEDTDPERTQKTRGYYRVVLGP